MNTDLDMLDNFNTNYLSSDSNYYSTDDFISNFTKTSKGFSILHVNSRSLSKNFDSLETMLYSLNNFPFSVIGVTETWLHSTSPNLFELNNYTLVRQDRTDKRGGGIAFYISEQLQFKIRKEKCIQQSESLFLEIMSPNNKNIIIGLIYRPPHSSINLFCEDLDKCLHTLTSEGKQLYLMGDFNIDLITQSTHHDPLIHIMYSNSCYPHINKPTRIDGQSSTLIDNIFSNILDQRIISGILYSDISDHLPIFAMCYDKDISMENPPKLNMYRKETPQNIESFQRDLAVEQWIDIYNESDVDIAYGNFYKKITYYYEKNCPLVSAKKKNKPKMPWITKAILRSIRKRNKLYKTYLTNPTFYNNNKYKTYRNKLTNIIRISRKMYYSDQFDKAKSNMKYTWDVINDLIGKKGKNSPNDNFTMDNIPIKNEDISYTFNSFFVNVGPNLANKLDKPNVNFDSYLYEPATSSMFFNPTNPNEIIEITKSLKLSKSKGHDGISNFLLKQIIHSIASPLTHIFNLSINTGKCPDTLKIAKVNPIFKKDNPHEITNYRPISILPSISKILEKIIYKRVYKYLDTFHCLNLNQYGFRNGHSTDLALIQLYDRITAAMANKEHVIGIFMDLSKAFDTLDHQILLKKLNFYGIRGVALSWFNSYLSNRQQYVVYNGVSSNLLPVKCGVPQGSILGPLLFLLYINDITNTSSILSFLLFADDTNIFCSHHNLNTLINILNNELPKLSLWFKCNKLSLNINKTNFMYFKHAHSHADYFPYPILIDDVPLERKRSTKFLGVTIDELLNWNEHIHNITISISRNIGLLFKIKRLVPSKTLVMLYNSLILPYITYCNIVWATSSKTKINSIYLLQKKAVRICTDSQYLAHSRPLFHQLKTLTLFDINSLHSLLFIYKYLNNMLPHSFQNFYTLNNAVHSYPTRSSSYIHLVNPKLLIAHKSIRHHGPDLWNPLPEVIKSSTTLSSFKSKVKTMLLSEYAT